MHNYLTDFCFRSAFSSAKIFTATIFSKTIFCSNGFPNVIASLFHLHIFQVPWALGVVNSPKYISHLINFSQLTPSNLLVGYLNVLNTVNAFLFHTVPHFLHLLILWFSRDQHHHFLQHMHLHWISKYL